MKESDLTQEMLEHLFTYDEITGELTWKNPNSRAIKAGARAGNLQSSGYRQVSIGGTKFMEHRVIWILMNGPIPPSLRVDHRNNKRHENWLLNLRCATRPENARNRLSNIGSSSKYKGVRKDTKTGKWKAKIWLRGKHHSIGVYNSESEAAIAYASVAKTAHGDFFNNGVRGIVETD